MPPLRSPTATAPRESALEETSAPTIVSPGFVDALQHVLLFADWRARGSAPCVCKTWRDGLVHSKNDSHWQWLCERLRDENRLYVPAGMCPSTDGWHAHFGKLWQQRNLWKVDETATAKASATEVDEAWRRSSSSRRRRSTSALRCVSAGRGDRRRQGRRDGRRRLRRHAVAPARGHGACQARVFTG